MPEFDSGRTLAERFRHQAGTENHLYGHLMREMATDWEAAGPVAEICRGYEDSPSGAAVQLRLLAGLFRLVLTGRADELLPFYPCLGGGADPGSAWPVARRVMADHVPELRAALEVPPQTNEPGRAAALLVGLAAARAWGLPRRVELLELGASAGLNLLMDRFRITGADWGWGPVTSPLRLSDAVTGPFAPPDIEIQRARGCDVDPVDPTDPEGVLRLRSFVWPFHVHRHERLEGALTLAAGGPPHVDKASAAEWLGPALGAARGVPVVWHSITSMYWPDEVVVAVNDILTAYGRTRPLAVVTMEYEGDERFPVVRASYSPGDGSRLERALGTAHPHGIPVRLY